MVLGGWLEVCIGFVYLMCFKLFLEGQLKVNFLCWMGCFFVFYECEVNYIIFLKFCYEIFVFNNDICFFGYLISII